MDRHYCTIREVNKAHAEWVSANFPEATKEDAVLGAIEELGELAHAMLKYKSRIRGFEDEIAYRAAVVDAAVDVYLYLLHLMLLMGEDYETAILRMSAHVHQRDWKAHPKTGYEEK